VGFRIEKVVTESASSKMLYLRFTVQLNTIIIGNSFALPTETFWQKPWADSLESALPLRPHPPAQIT